MGRPRPTSADVARLAGVSRTTVSFVLNGRQDIRIRPATRERVLEAANRLGYHPDAAAGQLARGDSLTIGLVLHMDASQIASDALLPLMLRGLGDAARGANYQVLIESLPPEPGGYRRLLQSRRVDGLIVSGPIIEDGELRGVYDDGFPVVVHGHAANQSLPSVDIDNVEAAQAAVGHLIANGHTSIAMITNAPVTYTSARERVEGYKLALQGAGIEFDPGLVAEGAIVAASGQAAMEALLQSRQFTAAFVASDSLAMGAMNAVRTSRLKVPDDISIVGFDDIPLAAHFDPPLTTVCVPAYNLGVMTGNVLLAQIKGEPVPQRSLLGTELQVRQSVARRDGSTHESERRLRTAPGPSSGAEHFGERAGPRSIRRIQ
jgi:DNA-binding LacI/PurR family transcriptional regulator